MMFLPHPISIVGSGLAGLATCAALRRIAGLAGPFYLYESLSSEDLYCPQAGAAVQLGPNGLTALEAIGGNELLEQVYSKGTMLQHNAVFRPGGAAPMIFPDTTLETTGYPQLLLPWAHMRSILLDCCTSTPNNKVTITTDVKDIVGYSYDPQQQTIQVVAAAAAAAATEFPPSSLLVAADGIYSTFGALINSESNNNSNNNNNNNNNVVAVLPEGAEDKARHATIQYGGRINIKAVAPVNLVELFPNLQPQTTYSYFAPNGVGCFAGPAGPGNTYWAISIPDDTQTKQHFLYDLIQQQQQTANNDKNPNGVDYDDIHSLSKQAVQTKLIETLQALPAPECASLAIDLIQRTSPDLMYMALSEERAIGSTLTTTTTNAAQDDVPPPPLVLVGDAAHAMSAGYGQAANFAFEDAVTLAAYLLSSHNNNNNTPSISSALRDYSESRLERCREMQRRSAERAQKAARGEMVEDVSKWIYSWKPPTVLSSASSSSSSSS